MDNKNNNGFKIDFNYDDPNIYNDKYEDISSNYTDISSSSKPEDTQPIKAKKKKRKNNYILYTR